MRPPEHKPLEGPPTLCPLYTELSLITTSSKRRQLVPMMQSHLAFNTGPFVDLVSCLQMMKTETLPEVTHQVDESKLCLQVGNKMAAWVLNLIQVHSDISQQNGVLTP